MSIKRFTFFTIGILLILLAGRTVQIYITRPTQSPKTDNKIRVTVSFYPLFFFASQIGGDKTQVISITPTGSEPHDYEPTTQDIVQIEKSDVLILNGGQLENWGDKIKENLNGKKTVIITAAEELTTQDSQEEGRIKKDPHVWLDPVLAKKEATVIAQALINVDPANKAYYEQNAKQLQEKLDALDSQFRQGLQHCQQKNIITSHAAFGYIASRYNLKQVPIAGLSPDSEPSPKQLGDVAQFAKTNNVKYIFFETLVSPRLAQTIAKEVGAKTLVFNPLEGLTKEQEEAGKNYLSIQKENLENLKIALECK